MAKFILNQPEERVNRGEVLFAHGLRKLPDDWIVVWGVSYSLQIANRLARLCEFADEAERPTLVLPDKEISMPGPIVEEREVSPEEVPAAIAEIINKWTQFGLCRPRDILLLGLHRERAKSSLGTATEIAGIPLADFASAENSDTGMTGKPPETLRYLNIDRAKGIDELAVIVFDIRNPEKFPAGIAGNDAVKKAFAGASRARQMLGFVWGN